MPLGDEMTCHRIGRGAIVEADAGVPLHGIDAPGQHVGPVVVAQQRKQSSIVVEADEHQRIDAVLYQLLGNAQLGIELVVMLCEHQRIAVRIEALLECAGGAGIERVVERRNHRADHLASVAA